MSDLPPFEVVGTGEQIDAALLEVRDAIRDWDKDEAEKALSSLFERFFRRIPVLEIQRVMTNALIALEAALSENPENSATVFRAATSVCAIGELLHPHERVVFAQGSRPISWQDACRLAGHFENPSDFDAAQLRAEQERRFPNTLQRDSDHQSRAEHSSQGRQSESNLQAESAADRSSTEGNHSTAREATGK